MAGAGTFAAGAGLAGADLQSLSLAAVPMVQAAQYDPRLRVIVQNADGTTAEVHPVDQTVAYCLTIKLGTISSDPTRGFDWDKLKATAPQARQHAATDLVKRALAKPLAAGDVTIVSVQLRQDLGRLAVVTNYINNRLPNAQQVPFTATFNG